MRRNCRPTGVGLFFAGKGAAAGEWRACGAFHLNRRTAIILAKKSCVAEEEESSWKRLQVGAQLCDIFLLIVATVVLRWRDGDCIFAGKPAGINGLAG
jgi:hypothetical protein